MLFAYASPNVDLKNELDFGTYCAIFISRRPSGNSAGSLALRISSSRVAPWGLRALGTSPSLANLSLAYLRNEIAPLRIIEVCAGAECLAQPSPVRSTGSNTRTVAMMKVISCVTILPGANAPSRASAEEADHPLSLPLCDCSPGRASCRRHTCPSTPEEAAFIEAAVGVKRWSDHQSRWDRGRLTLLVGSL